VSEAPEYVCERCRVRRELDGACALCGAEATQTLALVYAAREAVARTGAPRNPPWDRVKYALLSIPLLGSLAGGVLGAIERGPGMGWFFILIGLPATGLLWSALTGRQDGLIPFLRIPAGIRGRLAERRVHAHAPLQLAAPMGAEPARTGVVDAPRGEVVVRFEAWFLPRRTAPFAWHASTGGFTLRLDDGSEVEVPSGPLRVHVPEGHPRRRSGRRLGRGGPRGYRVAVELRGGQRVRLDAELQAAAPAALGYREPVRRFVTRGRPTLELLPKRP
jgi:hypothetical protein